MLGPDRHAVVVLEEAARSVPVVLHYTVGFTIEEQARSGAAFEHGLRLIVTGLRGTAATG